MICIESITEKGGENLPFFVGRTLADSLKGAF